MNLILALKFNRIHVEKFVKKDVLVNLRHYNLNGFPNKINAFY